jgi:glucokinase
LTGTNKAIGVDIGGTKTVVAAVDCSGRVLAQAVFETRSNRGFIAGLAELVETIGRVLTEANWSQETLCGIGIGCTGPVNPLRGTIHNPYTLPGWDDADIVTPLRQAFGVPVCIENDADAAAVGEFHFGAGRHANPLVMVTLGTGVGGALLVDGQIHRGVNGEHAELGHVPVLPDGPACYCGTKGCWESLASGTAIAAAGKPFGFRDSRAVFDAAPVDPRAAAIIERAVNATATATWTLLHTFLPHRILLGGGLGEAHFDSFAAAMRRQVSRATQIPKDSVEILKAQLGNDAGVIGAACLALQPGHSPK